MHWTDLKIILFRRFCHGRFCRKLGIQRS